MQGNPQAFLLIEVSKRKEKRMDNFILRKAREPPVGSFFDALQTISFEKGECKNEKLEEGGFLPVGVCFVCRGDWERPAFCGRGHEGSGGGLC